MFWRFYNWAESIGKKTRFYDLSHFLKTEYTLILITEMVFVGSHNIERFSKFDNLFLT